MKCLPFVSIVINLPVKLICFKSVSSAKPFYDVGSYCCESLFSQINKILPIDLHVWVVEQKHSMNLTFSTIIIILSFLAHLQFYQ